MTKPVTANETIEVMRRMFPSLYRFRSDAILGILINSGTYWDEGGRIHCGYENESKFNRFLKLFRSNKAPTVEQLYCDYQWSHAVDQWNESLLSYQQYNSVEEIYNRSLEYGEKQKREDRIFGYISDSAPIFHIPENADEDWLEISIALLRQMKYSKVDFDENSVLNEYERERKAFRIANPEIAVATGKMIAELLKEVGEPSITKEEWQARYSDAAKAKRANTDNSLVAALATVQLDKLRKQGKVNVD